MRIDEVVSLSTALKSNQYIKLLKSLKSHAKSDINTTRIKNQIMKSWSKGMTSRKHYDKLLNKIHLSLNNLIK